MIQAPISVAGLTDDEQVTLNRLYKRWAAKFDKNALLDVYYDGHKAFKDLGISIPPQMQNTHAALGWPAKAVQALARKHVWEGFSLDGSPDPFELGEVLARNDFDVELPQVFNAAYRHGVAFLTVEPGVDAGDPPVVIQARDAKWASALWDMRRRQISAAIAVTEMSKDAPEGLESPSELVMWTRDAIVVMRRSDGRWSAERLPNRTGRVLVEKVAYDPQIGRPFGHSRITREVRYLTDAALRTMVRAETGAEFFSSPQRYVLGASESAFEGQSRWTAISGRITVLDLNDEGDKPDVGQFPQMSMEPHLAMYRQLAQNFCAATNLPQSQVGLFADNPASAEAMQAAEAALSDEAEHQWKIVSSALRRTAQNALMVRDGLTEPPAESWDLHPTWTPARYVSPQAAADTAVKIVGAFPALADSAVAMRLAGLTQEQIMEVRSEQRRTESGAVLDRLLAAAPAPTAPAPQEPTEAPVEVTSGDDQG